MKEADLPSELHCCWDVREVMELLGLQMDGTLTGDCEMSVCPPCLTSLNHFFQGITAFQRRIEGERAMSAYIRGTVWPCVSQVKQHLLRAVLYRAPFRIRTPDALHLQAYHLAEQLLGCVNVELAKRGQAPVNDVEQAAFMAFAKSVYHPSVDTPSSAISDVSAFSLAGLSAVLAGGS